MKLENKNVLITGAANRIGREIAISLSKLGFNIGIHYNSSESSANQTLKLVKKNKVEASIIQSDLSNEKNLDPAWWCLENSCDDAPIEDAFHVLFDCARHADTARADLLRASARWCTRANVPHDCDGRRAALHWAMTDQPPPSSPLIALQSPTACAELRQCIQHCYALSLSRRYNKTKDAASQHLANK